MMAIKNEFPPPHLAELALKDILEDLGIAPIVLEHWKVSVEEDYVRWGYIITLSWRTYLVRKYIGKGEGNFSQISSLRHAANLIARDLCKYNAAEDEEHMEAIMLLSMSPTNDQYPKQL